MAHDYLVHYGVKGMKWGVRKSRPSMGQRRRTKKTPEQKKAFRNRLLNQNIKGGKDKPPVSPAERMISESRKSIDSTSGILKRLSDRKKSRQAFNSNVKNMSNSELQTRINRLNLEKQYKRLVYEDTHTGFDTAADILDTMGDVLVVAGGVVTVAATVNKLRK